MFDIRTPLDQSYVFTRGAVVAAHRSMKSYGQLPAFRPSNAESYMHSFPRDEVSSFVSLPRPPLSDAVPESLAGPWQLMQQIHPEYGFNQMSVNWYGSSGVEYCPFHSDGAAEMKKPTRVSILSLNHPGDEDDSSLKCRELEIRPLSCQVAEIVKSAQAARSATEVLLKEKEQVLDVQATDPQATDPQATDPQATDPQATDPQATDPKAGGAPAMPDGGFDASSPSAEQRAAGFLRMRLIIPLEDGVCVTMGGSIMQQAFQHGIRKHSERTYKRRIGFSFRAFA